jgi:O-antigen/teichoic acid export membrane protein
MNTRAIVARNAFALFVAQVITNLLSFVTVPLLARVLGSNDYGTWWLAGQVVGFAFLLVDCGQEGYIALAVARAPERAPAILSTTLAFRLVFGLAALPVLAGVVRLLGYDPTTRAVIYLFWSASLLECIYLGYIATTRGLERMDLVSGLRVVSELLRTAFVVVAIWLGAGIRGLAAVEIAAPIPVLTLWAISLRKLGVHLPRPDRALARELGRGGVPFLLWSGILAIQPGVEAVLLSKLASREAVGWYAATGKLVGLLLVPATLLMGAVGPTLARLHAKDPLAFQRAARESLRIALLMGAPVAVAAFVFAEPCMALVYGATAFAPAAMNLRVMSAYMLPVFLNIALGTVILASGRQMIWSVAKGATVAVSAGASFFVIPYWQTRAGNGGLGAAGMTAASEIAMLVAAIFLLPRGAMDRGTALDVLRIFGAAAAMAVGAHALSAQPFAIALGVALIVYAAALVLSGAVGGRDIGLVRDTLRSALRKS